MDAYSREIAGILLLTIVTIEFGGYFMTRIATGKVPMTDFQKSFARAGHAHAGVLVSLALITQLLFAYTHLTGPAAAVARLGVPAAAVLISGGFFAASAGKGRTTPNKAMAILWLGVLALAAGVLTLGVGLISA